VRAFLLINASIALLAITFAASTSSCESLRRPNELANVREVNDLLRGLLSVESHLTDRCLETGHKIIEQCEITEIRLETALNVCSARLTRLDKKRR